MSLLPIINIKNIINYDTDSTEYHNYLKYLNIYYEKSKVKTDKYEKKIVDEKYVLIDKTDNTKIEIKPSKFIDLNNYYSNLINEINKILYEISSLVENNDIINNEKREKFSELKGLYIEYNKKKKEIEEYKRDNNKIIDDIMQEKLNKYNILINSYNDRKETFSNINTSITNEIRQELIKVYKENGYKIPKDDIIEGISKKHNIKTLVVDNWFKWIESTYLYIKTQKELFEINNKLNEEINKQEENYKLFLYEEPEIKKIADNKISKKVEKTVIKKKIKVKKT